jgi:AcrR family transcriptional regulator
VTAEREPSTRRRKRDSQRWRLLEAMSKRVGELGYADTSVAEVIAAAGVSRKTFYEHFESKEACFLAAYDELSDRLIRALQREEGTARAQLRRYLQVLDGDVTVARALIVEVLAAGPKALQRREQVNARFATAVFGHLTRSPIILKAIIGGINNVVGGELMNAARKQPLLMLLPSLSRFVEQATDSRSSRSRA